MSRRAAMTKGFTLVEMMVALALGSLLAVVVAQLFANTRESNRATEDAARIQENMRYAAAVMGRTVRVAGYKSDPTADTAVVFPLGPTGAPALDGINGAGTGSDTLIVRFQGAPNNTMHDCLGAAVAPDYTAPYTVSFNKFSIATGADGRNALFCNTDPASASAGTEIVPGVEAMQVLFGEDTSTPADGAADRFVPVGDVGNIDNVVVVRVYLLLSGKESIKLSGASTDYPVGGVTYTFADKKIRRVVTQTFVLRNRAP